MGLYSKVDKLVADGKTVALVTITAVEGSTPRDPGTSMIVYEDGSIEGTIGGGNVEELSRTAAVEAIEEKEPRCEEWELQPGGNTGMVCNGTMEVFINVIEGQRTLLMVGGGHIAVPVVHIGAEVGYKPIVVEDRDEFADPDRFPEADVINATIEEGFDKTTITSSTAVVIATRSSALDRRAAKHGLESEAFYVGCVASDTKAEHIREGLREDRVDETSIAHLRAPVGLDLGADSPAQISLSILSEIEAVRTSSSGQPNSATVAEDEVNGKQTLADQSSINALVSDVTGENTE